MRCRRAACRARRQKRCCPPMPMRIGPGNCDESTWQSLRIPSISLATTFAGRAVVIALDEFFVLHHELLAAVGVHFGAECFGQMAPDVFIDVGDLVGLTCL